MQEVKISSESTPIPKQRSKLLSNPKNKQNICNFVFNDWIVKARQLLKENEKLTLSGGFKDGQTALQITRHSQANIDALRSDHEEADSRMFAHVSHAIELYSPGRVIIWSIDTDVAAICPRAMLLLDIKEIYFKIGVKNKKRFIPMHAVSSEIGHSISLVLPVAHAPTGCDSNSAFSGIGKRSMLNILKSDERMADAILDSLGVYPDEVDEEAMRACIKFVSNLYIGKGTYQSTTKMRKDLFSKKQLVSDCLPPTEPELTEHIKRANYQSYIWQNATKPHLELPSPEENGLSRSEDSDLVPTKNVNPPAPEGFIELTTCKCQTGCKNKRCACKKNDILCCDACFCGDGCENRNTLETDSDEDED